MREWLRWQIDRVLDLVRSFGPAHRRWQRGFNARLEALTTQERELFDACWDWRFDPDNQGQEPPPLCADILERVFGRDPH